MSPLSRLFQRHETTLLSQPDTLFFNPPADLPWQNFSGAEQAWWWTQDVTARDALRASGLETELLAFPRPPAPLRRIVLAQPREKALLNMLLHGLAHCLEPGGELLLAGELKAGGRSAGKPLASHFEHVTKLDNARHCVLFRATGPNQATPFAADAYRLAWDLPVADAAPLRVISYPGVFAHGRLDAGTGQLLPELAQLSLKSGARVLDLGCGAGVIGALLKRRLPGIELTMSDANALAVQASSETLAANQLAATALPGDGLRGLPGQFDLIVSNPPFHAGHRERTDLGAGLFEGVRNFLRPGGQLLLVVNRHLPWPRWMDQTLGRHDVLSAGNAYHVLSYRQPHAGRQEKKR